ncbi:exocyst complex component 1-like [Alosa alosa]|uniref:exocyst complex component 1-like n=1 Tax=Alosa sapidissima TaxID=34773 RepID=UPI001C0A5726|nr:exocyst complex component 1-like [Alosa sapidissima]XP_048126334.1 exocyst complex component 1-like [Alosa alosa]
MSSLLKEELQKRLFSPEGQTLKDFIEIEEPVQCRHFLCVSVLKNKEVQLSVVQCQKHQSCNSKRLRRSHFVDFYQKIEVWLLQDLVLLDGRNPDIDDPCFLMHFTSIRFVRAVSCAAKYSFARSLVALSSSHDQSPVTLKNFDQNYIQPAFVCSDQGDCTVLMRVCFYAVNLVWLSMCPAP